MAKRWDRPLTRLITVSATYGAGGSVVAPRLADRLGLPFADRLIPARGGPARSRTGECVTDEERDQVAKGAFLARLTHLTGGLNFPVPGSEDLHDHVQARVEESIGHIAATGGGVILGRAAAIVLAGDHRAFHVRLDGPANRRLVQGMAMEQVDVASVPFVDFIGNKTRSGIREPYSLVLRGYVHNWLSKVWAEYDRIGLAELVGDGSNRDAVQSTQPVARTTQLGAS